MRSLLGSDSGMRECQILMFSALKICSYLYTEEKTDMDNEFWDLSGVIALLSSNLAQYNFGCFHARHHY